jgi:hypothetical protein
MNFSGASLGFFFKASALAVRRPPVALGVPTQGLTVATPPLAGPLCWPGLIGGSSCR